MILSATEENKKQQWNLVLGEGTVSSGIFTEGDGEMTLESRPERIVG